MQNRRMRAGPLLLTFAVSAGLAVNAFAQRTLTLDQAVALAKQSLDQMIDLLLRELLRHDCIASGNAEKARPRQVFGRKRQQKEP